MKSSGRHVLSVSLPLLILVAWAFAEDPEQHELSLPERAWALYQAGDYNGAAALMEQSAREYEQRYGPEDPQTAFAFNTLAGAYRSIGQYDEAEAAARRALAIDEKAFGADDPHVADDLNILALIEADTGRELQAEPLYLRALKIREEKNGPEDRKVGIIINNLGLLYTSLGRYDKAEPLLERSLAITRKLEGEESLGMALALNNLGHVYVNTARFEKGEATYKQALEIRKKLEGDSHPDVAQSLNNLAYLYVETGRYAEAEPFYRQSVAIFEKLLGPDDPSLAAALNNLGGFYEFTGMHEEAEKCFRRSLAIYEKTSGHNSADAAQSMNNLAGLDHTLEKYDEARQLLEQVLEINKKLYGDFHPATATSYNNLAVIYDDLHQVDRSEELYKKALEIRQKIRGADHPDVATSLNNLAALYRNTNRSGQAEPLFKRAFSIEEKVYGLDHPNLAELCMNLGTFYDGIGKHAEAAPMLLQGVTINNKTRDTILSAFSERQKLKFVETQQPNVHALINHTLQFASRDRVQLQTTFNAWLQWKGSVQEAQGRYLDALMLSQDPAVQERWTRLVDVRKNLAKLWVSGAGDQPEEYRKQVAALEQQKDSLESDLSKLSKMFSLEEQVGRADALRLNQMVGNDGAYLDYVQTYSLNFKTGQWAEEGRYLLFLLLPGALPQLKLLDLGPAQEIEDSIHAYLRTLGVDRARGVQITAEEKTPVEERSSLERKLYDLLIKPVETLLAGRKRLIISPDGATHLLPFEVLKSEGKHLLERYEIIYTASGKDIARWSFPRSNLGDAVIFADPDYNLGTQARETALAFLDLKAPDVRGGVSGSLRSANFARLPGTRIEGESIKSILEKKTDIPVRLYEDKLALEEVLFSESSPRILHLATHGYFLPDQKKKLEKEETKLQSVENSSSDTLAEDPMVRSGLLLAGANTSLQQGGSEGIISAEKVLSLNLRNTDLVILSACETAVGDVQRGEGVFGLKRSFILAGARTLFLSLWQVSDEATQELMTDFYQRWTSGSSKAEALRQARLQLQKKYPDPYYWAPFILIGNPE